MPGKLKVRVVAARDLPVMDRASDLADAFAEVRFGQVSHKTDVYGKSLNPQWNSEWFKFEVDDEELQDEPLQIRVMDHDTYSAHDAIGKVYIDLNPLLWKDGVSDIAGWLPIYDTMHGIRGEIYIIVKVDLIEDVNRFRQSSVGVHFFNSSTMPSGYTVLAIHGFVEELVVNDDPEHQWIDMIRSPRASNEARQRLFSKLSGELQRKIGLRVLEAEGNAVLGYWQCFDLEGESGVVVRGIGTMATIQVAKLAPPTSPPKDGHKDHINPLDEQIPEDAPPIHGSPATTIKVEKPAATSHSPTKTIPPPRYASDPDLAGQAGSHGTTGSGGSGGGAHRRAVLPQNNVDMLEYPFFTITSFPPGFLVHLGGMVSTRSVKLLDRIHNPEEPETRDAWWRELRTEIRSHAIAMGCHAVVGYRETTSICEEICLLSASGTAAIVNLEAVQQMYIQQQNSPVMTMSLDRGEFHKEQQAVTPPVIERTDSGTPGPDPFPQCSICHIPYNDSALPFPVQLAKCALCKRSKVPDVLFTTIEPPPHLQYTGHGCCIQARVCRGKKKMQGEANAALISDALPFMEYELHSQMMNKLKVKGMNCLFGLKVQVSVGETLLIGTATATAVFLSPLPPPSALRISRQGTSGATDKQLTAFQERLDAITSKNKDIYGLHQDNAVEMDGAPQGQATAEELTDPQLISAHRETFVIEIDDIEDTESVIELFDQELPKGFHSCSTELLPGNLQPTQHLQTITMMRRASLSDTSGTTKVVTGLIQDMIQGICFKLRQLTPCCLSKMDVEFLLDEDEIMQIWLTTAIVGVRRVTAKPACVQKDTLSLGSGKPSADSEMMFSMEEVLETPLGSESQQTSPPRGAQSSEAQPVKLERRIQLAGMYPWRPEVLTTPLAIIPGATIDRYLGNLNLFFIRETTSVRESGGVSGFMRSFIAEVNAIVRRHVAALGGNALVTYTLVDCLMEDNPHKNQCQCLINVCGDAVHIQYDSLAGPPETRSGGASPQVMTAAVTRS